MATLTPTELDAPYPVDESIINAFANDGFVRLSEVLTPATIALFEPEITAKVIELNTQHVPLAERDTYGKAFLQVTNLWRHSDLVKRFVFSQRLAGIAADLLGVRAVRLYHDQALYKEPGGGITPWHADQYYWPLSSDRCVTVWVPLQETPIEMGPLAFAAGSHTFSTGRDMPISEESEQQIQQALASQAFTTVAEPYQLGSVSYHLGWTFHRASPNQATLARRVMTIIYIDADITVTDPMNDFQRDDLRKWMPGAQIGAAPETPLNPVLWCY